MSMTLAPGERTGCVRIPASKSQAHRLLICAALGAGETTVECDGVSADIEATARCLSALGAHMEAAGEGRFKVSPITCAPEGRCELYCGESGSTLRFLLPVAGALGVRAVFHMEGRLPERPLAPLDDVLRAHGMGITRQGGNLVCEGKLTPGEYEISGGVSSQYISGLLLALLAVLSVAACLLSMQLRRLQKGGEALAAGDLTSQVDTSHMYFDLKRHGENLNAISRGMSIAVEQKLKSERLKTELITNVSHDIKTPLTSIVNYVDLLQREHTPKQEREYLAVLDQIGRAHV